MPKLETEHDTRFQIRIARVKLAEIDQVKDGISRAEFIRQAITEHIKRVKRKQDKG